MLSKQCTVQRLVYGHMFMTPVGNPMSKLNGGPQLMEPRFQNFALDNHELEIYDKEDYTLFCKFCGVIAPQIEWASALGRPAGVS